MDYHHSGMVPVQQSKPAIQLQPASAVHIHLGQEDSSGCQHTVLQINGMKQLHLERIYTYKVVQS